MNRHSTPEPPATGAQMKFCVPTAWPRAISLNSEPTAMLVGTSGRGILSTACKAPEPAAATATATRIDFMTFPPADEIENGPPKTTWPGAGRSHAAPHRPHPVEAGLSEREHAGEVPEGVPEVDRPRVVFGLVAGPRGGRPKHHEVQHARRWAEDRVDRRVGPAVVDDAEELPDIG